MQADEMRAVPPSPAAQLQLLPLAHPPTLFRSSRPSGAEASESALATLKAEPPSSLAWLPRMASTWTGAGRRAAGSVLLRTREGWLVKGRESWLLTARESWLLKARED